MWIKVDEDLFGPGLEPEAHEVYSYYDGPRIFLRKYNGRQFYIHQADEALEYWSFFAREVTDQELAALKKNEITLREFLFAARPLYLVKDYTIHGGGPFKTEAFIVDPHDFAPDHFPVEGVYLYASAKDEE